MSNRRLEKRSTCTRTSISVPRTLKERMGQAPPGINWSALACRAFRDFLTQLDSVKSEDGSVNFMGLFALGMVNQYDIDDYVDSWHAGNGKGETLPKFLGMTDDEYKAWVLRPDSLTEIIEARKADTNRRRNDA